MQRSGQHGLSIGRLEFQRGTENLKITGKSVCMVTLVKFQGHAAFKKYHWPLSILLRCESVKTQAEVTFLLISAANINEKLEHKCNMCLKYAKLV